MAESNEITFLSPVPPSLITEHPLAHRLDTLAGRRIGLLDNRKANAGALLDSVAEQLTARFADVEVVTEHKLASAAAPDDVLDRLRTCHAVVLAIAD
jgi:hypothetical protein